MPLTGVKLSPRQAEELKEAFIIYDSDGDGKVTREQAICVIRCLGISPTNEEFNKIVGDRERFFTLQEIQGIIASKCPPFETENNLREAIRIFDKDGNSYVDAKELRHVLVHLGEKLTDEDVDGCFRDVEVNVNNQINCDDMVQVLMGPY